MKSGFESIRIRETPIGEKEKGDYLVIETNDKSIVRNPNQKGGLTMTRLIQNIRNRMRNEKRAGNDDLSMIAFSYYRYDFARLNSILHKGEGSVNG